MQIRQGLILGAHGGFGKLFSHLLSHEGVSVHGVDLALAACSNPEVCLHEDLMLQGDALTRALASADCVVACVPEPAAFYAVQNLTPLMKRGSLFVDIMSVKSEVTAQELAARSDLEFLSLGPMFGPSLGFVGQSVAFIEVRPGPRSEQWKAWLQTWGSRVVCTSAQDYDQSTAKLQVTAHAALISFGATLGALGGNVNLELELATPLYRHLLSLFARMASADPEVYRHIQADHPLAQKTRLALQQSMANFAAAVDSGDAEAFSEILDSGKAYLQDNLQPLADACAQTFKAAAPFFNRRL